MLPTMHDAAVERIAAWIIAGRFGSGVLPTEPELGETLGVSRTVVREAIKALAAKGMVTTRKRAGTAVCPNAHWHMLDPTVVAWLLRGPHRLELVRDLVEIRLAIEPFAAELAASRRSELDLETIESALVDMAAAVDGRGNYVDADLRFHSALLVASGNRFVVQMLPMVAEVLRLSFEFSTASLETARGSLPNHRALLDAVRRHDAAHARAVLEGIIRGAGEDIARYSREKDCTGRSE